MKNSENLKKIIIMGLENSGKTSIVLSLTKNTNLLSYCSLKPTIDIDRINYEYLGTKFSIWDFGGQKKYRDQYLKQLDSHLIGIDKVIYVIDVQDKEKYELALSYLAKIVEKLKNVKEQFETLIFLHKFDPNLELLPEYSDKNIDIQLIDKIEKILPSEIDYKIFKTTIYTVFQRSLVR
ncbi:MAG: ADP-ribosylation factor-like protein [Candidatus Helarchaeota archaeon]